jgi:hypothetical protein
MSLNIRPLARLATGGCDIQGTGMKTLGLAQREYSGAPFGVQYAQPSVNICGDAVSENLESVN